MQGHMLMARLQQRHFSQNILAPSHVSQYWHFLTASGELNKSATLD